MLTSSNGKPFAVVGSDVTLTCTLVLNSVIMGSENALLMVDAQLSRDGTPLALPSVTVIGTTFTYTTVVNSFERSDSGNYTCTATVRPQPAATYLNGTETLESNINIRAGKYLLTLCTDLHIIMQYATASLPPLNVRATQYSSSAPVEISWSPPSDGASIITGYRIFYGNGQSVLVPSVTAITLVGLKVDESYVGQIVSIRSEADQLYSKLVNVSVVDGK